MRKKSDSQSGFFNPRIFVAFLLAAAGISLAMFSFAANPTGGTITPTSTAALTWIGTADGIPPNTDGVDACDDPAFGEGHGCDTYTLDISGTPADWAGKQVHVQIVWGLPSTDYDLYVQKNGATVANSGAGGTTIEQVDLNPSSPSIGTGQFTVRVVYFAPNTSDQYSGAASVKSAGSPPVPAPAPSTAVFAPRFENFNPPAQGPATLGLRSGEPSIGIGAPIAGHPEGRAMFQADLQTLRVTFNNASPKTLWENKPAPTSQQDFDPILWSDPATGRTVVHLLTFAGNVIAGESSVTDTAFPANDGDVWTPSKGSGVGSGVDHQTVGGGPYNEGAVPPPPLPLTRVYPNAVYYCSQALVDASCARSDDGGINYGPSTVTYTSECGGLHGHVKVGPDGTVYLPNKGCGGQQGVVASEDNGLTWSIRTVPGSTSGGSDPSVAVDKANKLYMAYGDGDTKLAVSTSTDHGSNWSQPYNVGAAFGLNNVAYPAFVAGDAGRAAVTFLGTPTTGGLQDSAFAGVWHLYVATTYDGGATWTTVDATPNDAVQRGCIWQGGGANVCRNLLDFFDATIDHEGRILIGYADGCAGGECIQAPTAATGNAYTALAAIARQSGGKRMFAAFDSAPNAAASVPGVPSLSAHRDGSVVRLSWSEADNGGSPIQTYRIYRGTSSGTEVSLKSVKGSQLSFDDTTATNTAATYYYKVAAANSVGWSAADNEVAARYAGSSASGYTILTDPSGATAESGTAATPDLDIQTLKVSQPTSGVNAGKLVFTLKVASLASMSPQAMWRIVWNSPKSRTSQFYVGMTNDSAGNGLTFEYGTVSTSTVGLVLGLPATTKVGTPDSGTETPDGTITIAVSPDKVGRVTASDILGGFAVRTYANVDTNIRSTNAIDSTSNATANDNTANAATYVVVNSATSTGGGGKKPPRN